MEKSRANLAIASAAFVLGWAFNSYHTKKKLAPILDSQHQSIQQLSRHTHKSEALSALWYWQNEDHESLRRLTGFEKHCSWPDGEYEFWK